MPHKNRTLKFLENARDQIILMKENDYTLARKFFALEFQVKSAMAFVIKLVLPRNAQKISSLKQMLEMFISTRFPLFI